MEEMIKGLIDKVGLDADKANAVVAFLKENASKIPQWLGDNETVDAIKDKLPGGLGKLF